MLPVGFVQLLRCVDDVVSVVLRGKLEGLCVIDFNKLLEAFADHSLVYCELILSNVGDLKEHGCDHVDALEELKVYVHVIRDLSSLLLLLKFNRFIRLSADSLSENLPETRCRLYLREYLVALFDQPESECSHADLSDSAVVQDLIPDVL